MPPRVLFVPGANPRASFVRHDLEILRRRFEVVVLPVSGSLVSRAGSLLRAVGWLTSSQVQLVFMWFAAVGYAPWITAAARLLRIPVAIVTGGADVANQPDIGFGDARVGWRRALIRWTLESASLVLPFSESARRETCAVAPRSCIRVSPPAVRVPCCGGRLKGTVRDVLTVSAITPVTLKQKGLETFVRAAAHVPDARFLLIGTQPDRDSLARLRSLASPNVELLGALPDDELHNHFCSAHVYVQVSSHEGFGVAVIEAMAAGCHLLVTDRGSLREVVGDHGRYVPYDDVAATAAAIRAALEAPPLPDRSRDLSEMYGHRRREQDLISALCPLCKTGANGPSSEVVPR